MPFASHPVCSEMGHPVLSLLESQWKLRQQYDQNFPIEGKPFRTNTSIMKEINPEEQDCESHSQGSK